jgi:hypothetical protein
MELVEPIRDKKQIQTMKEYLRYILKTDCLDSG